MIAVSCGLTLTRLTALGTLSRNAGERGSSPQGWVGEGTLPPQAPTPPHG
jgi:hypothetical protein